MVDDKRLNGDIFSDTSIRCKHIDRETSKVYE